MDTIDKVKKLVLEGNVLDDQGAWVTLAARKDTEKKIIDRLTGGKVLCNGGGFPFRKRKSPAERKGSSLRRKHAAWGSDGRRKSFERCTIAKYHKGVAADPVILSQIFGT